jgi:hypothetical protein
MSTQAEKPANNDVTAATTPGMDDLFIRMGRPLVRGARILHANTAGRSACGPAGRSYTHSPAPSTMIEPGNP